MGTAVPLNSPFLKGRGGVWLATLFLLFSFLLAIPAFAQTFPPLSGRVVDQAQILSPAQAADLDAKLTRLEQQSGRQMVVATVASLENYPIEDYGYRLGRAWGLGDKKANDGLILLVAPNDRKVRIEVGYGLEPIVTDALSSVIIQRRILPRFKAGDMPGGIAAATDALVQLLELPPDQARAQSEKIVAENRKDRGGFPISLIFWIIVILFIFGSSIASRLGGGRRYRGGGSGPIVIWGGGSDWGGGSGGGWGGGGGFGGGGGSFGGGGSSGSW